MAATRRAALLAAPTLVAAAAAQGQEPDVTEQIARHFAEAKAVCEERDALFERFSYRHPNGYRCASGAEYFGLVRPLDARFDQALEAIASLHAEDIASLRMKGTVASWAMTDLAELGRTPSERVLLSLFRDLGV